MLGKLGSSDWLECTAMAHWSTFMGSCSLPDRPLNLRKGRRRLAKGLAVSKRWGRRLTVIKCKSIQQFFFLETKRKSIVKTDVDCHNVIMRVRRTRRLVSFSGIYCKYENCCQAEGSKLIFSQSQNKPSGLDRLGWAAGPA